jgi:hypothetical protein
MSSDRARPLAEVLAGGALGQLAAEAAQRRTLTDRVRAELPPDLAEHLISAARTAPGELELCMDSSAWAARLRYALPRLGADRVTARVRPRDLER